MQIACFLSSASTQTALLRSVGASDACIMNCDPALAHAAAREFLSSSWAVHAKNSRFLVTVDAFPQQPQSRCLVRRVRHTACTATTVNLPRGRHVLQVSFSNPFALHAISISSRTSFQFSDMASLLSRLEETHGSESTGSVAEACEGTWRVVCRHLFMVSTPCNVRIQLSVAPAATGRSMSLLLINNHSLVSQVLPLKHVGSIRVLPNSSGYSVIVIQDTSDVHAYSPPGEYRLQVSSSAPVSALTPTSCLRCETFSGEYTPNRQGTVCRLTVSPMSTSYLTVRLKVQPTHLTGTLVLEELVAPHPGQGKDKKQKESKVQSEPPSMPGKVLCALPVHAQQTIPVIQVPAGRHLLSLTLDNEHALFHLDSTGQIVMHSGERFSGELRESTDMCHKCMYSQNVHLHYWAWCVMQLLGAAPNKVYR